MAVPTDIAAVEAALSDLTAGFLSGIMVLSLYVPNGRIDRWAMSLISWPG
jgi:hypothetical protein